MIVARDLLVARGGRTVLDVPALTVAPGELLAVIGPNGAGKSTLLRILGLLQAPARGTVAFGGTVPGSAAARLAARRRMASVFQDPLLCDVSVAANVRQALAFRGVGRAEAERRVAPWLERLGIAHLADRPARTLSGGEAQRTSLARAFAAEPEALFLDEPFAALDPATRETLVDEVGGLLAEAGATAVFVTHERSEALRLGDRVAVLLGGRLVQIGRPEEVFSAPVDEAVARLVGVENLLAGRVAVASEGFVEVVASGRRIAVVGEAAAGEPVLVGLRPEDVVLQRGVPAGPTSARNHLPGTVARVVPLGALCRVVVECGPRVTAVVTRPSVEHLALVPGAEVTVSFKATAAHLIRPRRRRRA